MKLTIIPSDRTVYVDGVSKGPLDLSVCNIPSNIHALQWKETSGWIEYEENADGSRFQNEEIQQLPDWATASYTVWSQTIPRVSTGNVIPQTIITANT